LGEEGHAVGVPCSLRLAWQGRGWERAEKQAARRAYIQNIHPICTNVQRVCILYASYMHLICVLFAL
jgi:hypothetical protein